MKKEFFNIIIGRTLVRSPMNVPGRVVHGNLQDQMSLPDITENIQVNRKTGRLSRPYLK